MSGMCTVTADIHADHGLNTKEGNGQQKGTVVGEVAKTG